MACLGGEIVRSRLACDPSVLLLNENPSSQNELVVSLALPGLRLFADEIVKYFWPGLRLPGAIDEVGLSGKAGCDL